MPRPGEDRSNVGGAAQFTNIGPVPLSLSDLSRFPLQRVAREGWAEIKMPRPGEDRSDVGGAAQFNNIGPVPLSQYRTCPAFSRQAIVSGKIGRKKSLALASWCAMMGRMCKIGEMVSGEIPGRGGDYPCPSIKKHAGWNTIVAVWRHTMRATDGLQTT